MAQKNATPTKEQSRVIKKNGLAPALWVVIQRLTAQFNHQGKNHRRVPADQ